MKRIQEVPAHKKPLLNLTPQRASYLKRPFRDQGQRFLYIGTIKSNQVKVCDSTVHASMLKNYYAMHTAQYNLLISINCLMH